MPRLRRTATLGCRTVPRGPQGKETCKFEFLSHSLVQTPQHRYRRSNYHNGRFVFVALSEAPRCSSCIACCLQKTHRGKRHPPPPTHSKLAPCALSLSSDYPQTMQSVALDVWSVFMRKTEPEFRTISSSREKLVWRQKKSTQLSNDETTCAFIASQIHLETSDDIVRRVGFEFCMRIGLIVKIPRIASVNVWKLFPPFPRLTSASQIENNR